MKILRLVLAVLFLHSNSGYAYYFKLAGAYEATVEELYECEDVGTHQIKYDFKIKKVNATTRVGLINLTHLVDADDSVTVNFNAAKWTSGGWGNNAVVVDGKNYCRSFRDYLSELFIPMCNALDIPPECPIPSGSYYSKPTGTPVKYKNLKMFPQAQYGRYKVAIVFMKGDVRLGCIVIMLSLDEIPSS